jgi:HEAT repeat protein
MAEKAISDWIQDLNDRHWSVRRAAAEALGRSGAPEAVEPLLELLKREEWKTVRAEAIRALGCLGDPRSVEAILEALQDPDLHLHRAAEQACRAFDPAVLVPRLFQLLRADYLQLLRDDVNSFQDFLRRIEAIRARVVEVLVALGPEALPWAVEALQDPNWRVQQAAIQVLGEIGGRPALKRLKPLARRWPFRERVEVKEAARQAIARIQTRLRAQGSPHNERGYRQA